MSTNILAFAVGHFDFIESITKEKIAVRMYTLPGKVEQGKFALGVTANAVSFFDEYFQSPLPLPKLDSIIVPSTYYGNISFQNFLKYSKLLLYFSEYRTTVTEAMENFGLITYQEANEFEDPKDQSEDTKISIATDMCHEVCHQWCGDLVSVVSSLNIRPINISCKCKRCQKSNRAV